MRTVGHRGASAMAPENTLLAIRLAISHRLDFAEVDVHLSRDGQLVVHHDAHFTDGTLRPSLWAANYAHGDRPAPCAGLQVMAPHTNDPAEAERFREAGADLVASDDPRLLVALIERSA